MPRKKIKEVLSLQEQRALLSFQAALHSKVGANLSGLILFGSRARMEGDEDSDVDVLVLLKKENRVLKRTIWDLAYKIFSDTGILISPLVLSKAQFDGLVSHERLIAKDIQEEGIKL